MRLTVLVDNNAREGLTAAHGLSLYIETDGRRILFDFGPDGALLLKNAEALGIDLKSVDMAALSHGHSDHAGGLEAFLTVNERAPVYVQKQALEGHFVDKGKGLRDLSADATLPERFPKRIRKVFAIILPEDGLYFFALVPLKHPAGKAHDWFFSGSMDKPVPDDFKHEMHLLVHEGPDWYLFAGCAHQGIQNILEHAADLIGVMPKAVFGGLHLMDEDAETVAATGAALQAMGVDVYTDHCTGDAAYAQLKDLLGDRIHRFQAGDSFVLGDD